jgi:hypothetical protein
MVTPPRIKINSVERKRYDCYANQVIISVTRLHLRHLYFTPSFLWYSMLASRQAGQAPGFLGGRLLVNRDFSFWTMTAWENEAVVRAYRNGGAHLKAMPHLSLWCDESLATHWEEPQGPLPSWELAYQKLSLQGHSPPLKVPSEHQATRTFSAPQPPYSFREFPIRRAGGG